MASGSDAQSYPSIAVSSDGTRIATVWSDYGMGYVFIPVLLPLSALYWLKKSRTATAATQ